MKRIIIYGGSFDPPTTAHIAITKKALEQPGFDEVWLMPCSYRKEKITQASDTQRLDMLKLVKKNYFHNPNRLKICDIELNLPKPSETVLTYKYLLKAFPEMTFCFIFGSDSYLTITDWKDGKWLLSNMEILVVPRPGYPLPAGSAPACLHVDQHPISSTEVRALVRERASLNGKITPSIEGYIKRNCLYA